MSSRHKATLAAVFENPVRANRLWNDLVAMLASYGATFTEREGSRVVVQLRGRKIVLHRPHPRKELERYAIRAVRTFLTNAGLTP